MKLAHLFLAAAVGALVALGANHLLPLQSTSPNSQPTAKEMRWEQVKRTGTLRCGYMIWPPVLVKDPNTGQMSGLMYDLLEEIGKQLNVKIVWTVEAAPGQMFSDLSFNRYDVMCLPFFVTPSRLREGSFTTPFIYWPLYLYARNNDTRFDNNYAKANDPNVSFTGLDGDFSSIVPRDQFPKASIVSLSQMASSAEFFNAVAGKKADLVVTEPLTFQNYAKNNPNIVRQVKGKPVYAGITALPLPARENGLKEVLDGTLAYLQGTGFIEGLLKKYETPDFRFLHLVKPYADEKGTAP